MRRRYTIILLFLMGLLIYVPIQAQDTPLLGPIIALNTVQQDHIILYDIGSDQYRNIKIGQGDHHVWDFSPDGCQLLVTLSKGADPATLYQVDLMGHSQKLIDDADLASGTWGVWEPTWSPNGDRIALTMIREQTENGTVQRTTHIAWIDANGGIPQFYSVSGHEYSPMWSPDGQWLVYVSYDPRVPGADLLSTAVPTPKPANGVTPPESTTIQEADLWVVSADGQTKYPLTQFDVGSVSKPRWSPDGELVSFVYSVSDANDMFWMIANQPNAIPTQLSYHWSMILDTTWLPDSTHIIGSVRDFRDVSENRLWQIPLVGSADDSAILYLPNVGLDHADFPRFSPDGQYLAVRTAYELALVDLSIQTMTLLDAMTMSNTSAVWSPTGFHGENTCHSQ